MCTLLSVVLVLRVASTLALRAPAPLRPTSRLGSVWYDGGASLRRPIIAGNWKLNPATAPEADALLRLVAANARAMVDPPEVVVFPPAPYVARALELLEGSGVSVGAQHVDVETSGAFTGQVAASMLRSVGCDYVLVGHSERRSLYDETDDGCNAKVKRCLAEPGLKVILCVGETLGEFEADLLDTVVGFQVRKGLAGVDAVDVATRVVVGVETDQWFGSARRNLETRLARSK